MAQQLTQGVDPKGKVFAELYPMLYAAETPVSASYVASSLVSATCADMMIDLRGKRVLDAGCGYGTTAAAIASFRPNQILCLDSSQGMIDLLSRVMLGDEDLDDWFGNQKGAEEALGDLYRPTLQHLKRRRAEFRNGPFRRSGGRLETLVESSLNISPEAVGHFDAIIGNNFLHWPVNAQKTPTKEEAIINALKPLANVLNKGGAAIFMEPKDFVTVDTDAEIEADCEKHTMVSHPLYRKFHETFNRLLKENYGKDRKVPTTTGLFKTSTFGALAREAGFKLLRIAHCENAFVCEPVQAFYVRLPLVLGNLDLSFDDKIKLGKLAMEEFRSVVAPEEQTMPIQAQSFFFCFGKL